MLEKFQSDTPNLAQTAQGEDEILQEELFNVLDTGRHFKTQNNYSASCHVVREAIIIAQKSIHFKYRLYAGFEVTTEVRSPRKLMYRRPEHVARGRLFRFPR